MSTGRRSRKAKLAASDMFKRFARGEDLLVGSISKYSYSLAQKQVSDCVSDVTLELMESISSLRRSVHCTVNRCQII